MHMRKQRCRSAAQFVSDLFRNPEDRFSHDEAHLMVMYAFTLQELEEFCFQFALNHMTAVTQTKAFSDLDPGILKDFIRKAGQAGAFRY